MNKSESKYFHTAERMDQALLALLLEKDFAYITVKDICARAKVSRSTFYLHYENTTDLLIETIDLMGARFQNKFSAGEGTGGFSVADRPLSQLFLITDQWLLPYLDFVRENQRFYAAIHTQLDLFGVDRAFTHFFQTLFSPILSRYGVPGHQHEAIMTFYRHGLTAVLLQWVREDCRAPAEEIAAVIKLCVGGPHEDPA